MSKIDKSMRELLRREPRKLRRKRVKRQKLICKKHPDFKKQRINSLSFLIKCKSDHYIYSVRDVFIRGLETA